jgi:mRNA interferase RelE/StbE
VASYSLLIKTSAAKELEDLPPRDRKRAVSKIQRLATEPRPVGAEKLSGQEKYRIRQGDYRILYLIDDVETSVVIVRIGHRSDVSR